MRSDATDWPHPTPARIKKTNPRRTSPLEAAKGRPGAYQLGLPAFYRLNLS